jgi:hypothetical protein
MYHHHQCYKQQNTLKITTTSYWHIAFDLAKLKKGKKITKRPIHRAGCDHIAAAMRTPAPPRRRWRRRGHKVDRSSSVFFPRWPTYFFFFPRVVAVVGTNTDIGSAGLFVLTTLGFVAAFGPFVFDDAIVGGTACGGVCRP